MVILNFLFLFLHILSFNQSMPKNIPARKTILSEYTMFDDSYFMFVKLDTSQFLFQRIDITSSYNTINRNVFEEQKVNKSTYIKDVRINLNESLTVTGEERVFTFLIGRSLNYTITIPEISLVIFPKIRILNVQASRFAFAYDIPDKNHSITHQLKANGKIDHLCFTLSREYSDYGLVYFGDIPIEIIEGLHKASCPIIGNERYWECELTHVFIGDISYANVKDNFSYINSYSSHFTTDHYAIKAPQFAYDILIDKVFNQAILNGKCNRESVYGSEMIKCNCNDVKSFASLIFVFNQYAFTFTSKELFKEVHSVCYYQIERNTKGDNWVIGSLFYKYITSFDYDLKSVVFYSNTRIDRISINALYPNNKIVAKYLFIISLILMTCMCIILLLIKTNK